MPSGKRHPTCPRYTGHRFCRKDGACPCGYRPDPPLLWGVGCDDCAFIRLFIEPTEASRAQREHARETRHRVTRTREARVKGE